MGLNIDVGYHPFTVLLLLFTSEIPLFKAWSRRIFLVRKYMVFFYLLTRRKPRRKLVAFIISYCSSRQDMFLCLFSIQGFQTASIQLFLQGAERLYTKSHELIICLTPHPLAKRFFYLRPRPSELGEM